MSKTVISYRRSDSDVFAGRIRDRLAACFGEDSVFIDIDSIPFGTDFRVHIQEALAKADAVLVVVGPRWLGAGKGTKSRIMDSTDPVRIEVEAALSKSIPTVPILVGNTLMPKVEQLPESLRNFAFINAARVDTGRDFHRDLDRVIATLSRIVELPSGSRGRVSSNALASRLGATRERSLRSNANRSRSSSKVSATIGGLVLLGILFRAAWWLWVAKAPNIAAVNVGPQLAGRPNANEQHSGENVTASTNSQRAAHNPVDELLGTYQIQGVNPNGSTYGGQVTITADGDVYKFRWRISNGDIYLGNGRLVDRIISVDWGQKYPVIYRLGDDGALRGTWANGTASEILVPIR